MAERGERVEGAPRAAEGDGARDEALVARAASGDKEAYRALVERYQHRVYSIAFEIVRNREDAEDVAQESFVKTYLSLKDFKGESSFFTWLYRIVYNMALDVRRRSARRGGDAVEFNEITTPASASIAAPLGHVEGPQEAALNKERAKVIKQVLGEISEEHRTVMMLREVEGLSYDEIAKVVGISKGTVMSRLHYARKALQKALHEFAPARGGMPGGNSGLGEGV